MCSSLAETACFPSEVVSILIISFIIKLKNLNKKNNPQKRFAFEMNCLKQR
nr:MAG TPA: hypothetical protein [Caudoviricetes sp.]